jgi:hypothetical protein
MQQTNITGDSMSKQAFYLLLLIIFLIPLCGRGLEIKVNDKVYKVTIKQIKKGSK